MRRPYARPALAAFVLLPLFAGAASAASRPVAVLAPLAGSAPAPAAAEVAAAVGPPAAAPALGGGLAGEVLDARTGSVLWQRAPGAPLLVASTQKLLTAAAALAVLGSSATATTALETTGTISGGVLSGDLVLRGGGDVLLQAAPNPGQWPATASVDDLAAALRAAGVTTVQGRVLADGSAFAGPALAPGWRPSYVSEGSVAPVSALELDHGRLAGRIGRVADPALAAGMALRGALAQHGVTVTGPVVDGTAAAGARHLAAVAGPPVAVEVEEMLQNSDNDLAESLGRRVAVALGMPPTFAGAAAAIAATLARQGLPVGGLHLDDASGLSRLDGVPPGLLAAVLRAAAGDSAPWRAILSGLPVAAFSGTLRSRDTTAPAAAGTVRAKTGNLEGVTAVAGVVVDAHGRQLVFAFVTDTARGLTASEAALDRLAASLVPL